MKRFYAALTAFLLSASAALASSCNVSEFPLAVVSGVQVAQMPALVDQAPITTSSTSAQSATFNSATGMVRVWCDTQSAVAIGANPTATTSNLPLSAGVTEYFSIVPGGPYKAAFVLRP